MSIAKANATQIRFIYKILSENLPNFFRGAHCFEIYSDDVILEDNIRNIKIVGLPVYKQNVGLVKVYSHLKYRQVELNVLKLTEHLEESCVKVRWRIVGSPNWTILLNYLSSLPPVKPNNPVENINNKDLDVWVDGFSIFYVNGNGKVCKHICDKLIPDSNHEENEVRKRLLPSLSGKLTTFSTADNERPKSVSC